MATLKEICNDVLAETGYQALTSVIGNSAQTPRQLLGLAQREGKTLAKKDWKILLKRNVLSTASSAEAYKLPDDYDRFIDNTHWNVSEADPMFGPVSTQRWQANKSGVVSITVNDRFQVRADGNANRFFVDPVPTSAENLSFFYAADTWCRSNGGERQAKWKADNDVLLLDDFVYTLGLKWRWLRAKRRAYDEEYREYERERDKAYARDGGMPILSILPPVDDWSPQANVGETNFGT